MSARSAVFGAAMFSVGFGITCYLLLRLIRPVIETTDLELGFNASRAGIRLDWHVVQVMALLLGGYALLWYGGLEVIKHLTLRWFLLIAGLLTVMVVLAGHPTVASGPAEEQAAIESRLDQLDRQRLEIELERKDVDRRLAEVRREMDSERQKRDGLHTEARAARLEDQGLHQLATLTRMEAEARAEQRRVEGEMREIKVASALQAAELEYERRVLRLGEREAQRARDRKRSEDFRRAHWELSLALEGIRDDEAVAIRSLEGKARVLRARLAEVRLQQAELQGDEAILVRSGEHLERAVQERVDFEIEGAYVELDRELRQELRRVERRNWEAERGSARDAELRAEILEINQDRSWLASSRRSHRAGVEIRRLQESLQRHLLELTRAAVSTEEESERENLEREIEELRSTIARSVRATLEAAE